MSASTTQPALRTPAGQFPLEEYRLRSAAGEWAVLHTGAILTADDEARFLFETTGRPPYGVALWPASVALAHDVGARGDALRGRRVLELGAGTGLPGIVAASLGARVVQTDRHELAMFVCRGNGARNGIRTIEYRLADWTAWEDAERYDWILGSDILYAQRLHPHLRRILELNLAPGGRVLIADPFRAESLRLLQALEADGWSVELTKWNVGEDGAPRPVGVYELTPPR